MVKYQPAALAFLGILWLIRDLYALENYRRLPRKDSDFYFDDVSTPRSYQHPEPDAIGRLPHQEVPLQPASSRPNDSKKAPGRGGKRNKGTKPMNDNKPEVKPNENETASKEKNVKKLLKDFVSLLLNLNDKEDSLIHQLTSYLGDRNDPPKKDPEHGDAPSTESSPSKAKPVTTTPSGPDEEEEDDDYEDDGYTSEIPQITITNVVLNNYTFVTPDPGQYVNKSQTTTPAVNNYKPMDILKHQEEMGMNPNNEFIDDLINSPINTPKNEGENPKNSTEPGEMKQKPSSPSPIDENASKPPENENSTKNPISMREKGSNERNYDNQFPEAQIPSEEPWHLNPISTERSYQIPFVPKAKSNLQNQEKEVTEEPMQNQQNSQPQISDPYHQGFYSKPIAFIPRRINYNRKPTYKYQPIPNMPNQIFRSSPQFYPKIDPELQPHGNQPQPDIPSGTVPFIPKYPNAAISNHDTVNPINSEKKEDKKPVDDILSAFPLKNDSKPSDGLNSDKNPQPLKPLPQTKNSGNDNPCNKLPIQNNSTDESVSENENANLVSTEFTLLLYHTEIANASTTVPSLEPPENNVYSTAISIPQKNVSTFRSKLLLIKPLLKRNRFRKPIQQNKLNNSTPLNKNQANSTLELPPENKLNDSKSSPENVANSTQESPNNQQKNTEGSVSQSSTTEIVPTSEKPLNSEPSLSNPRNNSSPLDSKQQSTEAPEVETQSSTLPDDSNEAESENSDDYDSSNEDDSSDETGDEEHDNTDDGYESDNEDAVDGNTDDEPFHDNKDADGSNNNDQGVKNTLNDLDKASTNNTTSDVPQNASSPILASTESPQNQTRNLNKSAQNAPVPSANNVNKTLQNSSAPSTDEANESPQNSPLPSPNDVNKTPQNPSAPLTDDSKESPQYSPVPSSNDVNKTPQNPSAPSKDDSNESPQRSPVPSSNNVNKTPQNPSAPSKDDSNESPQDSPFPSTDDFNKSPENPSAPSRDESNESPQNPPVPPSDDFKNSPQNFSIPTTYHPMKSPMNVGNGNRKAKRPIPIGPPYDNILDYIYSYSKNPFFRELREQQDELE